MSGPVRIFTKSWVHSATGARGVWSTTQHAGTTEYIRRDPAVLAELSEVQALIRQAVEAEREACAKVAHDAGKPFARMFIMRKLAGFGYNISVRSKQRMCIRIAAAIRKRGDS